MNTLPKKAVATHTGIRSNNCPYCLVADDETLILNNIEFDTTKMTYK